MVRRLLLILCIFLVVPLFSGCSEKEVQVVNKKLPPFDKLFKRTIEMYNSKDYKDAINSLLFLRENYPQKVAYQSRITLYLANSHFHQKEYPEAIANYKEFIKLYPTSPDTPYAYFQIGMSNYKQKRTYDRDATFVRKALKNFKKVLEISPPGILANESIRMIGLCKRELAMHDLFIADFYLRTHHYESAILCYKDVLKTYLDIKVRDRAYLGIAKANLKLKKKNKAYRLLSYVTQNYPSSPYGKEAWKILHKKFKVTSVDQLSMVTFPERKPVKKAMLKMPKKTKTKGHKVEAIETSSPKSAVHPSKVKEIQMAKKTPTTVKKVAKAKLQPKNEKKPSSRLLGALDTRQPIHITSDYVEAKEGMKSVRFYGNVEAKQKDVTLKCDDLIAYYTKGGKAIDRIIAYGKVFIKQRNKKVACGKAIFYNAKRRVVLDDSPKAWDGNNMISGGKMVLLLDKNEIQVLGTKKKPTELIIYPEKKRDLLKSPTF